MKLLTGLNGVLFASLLGCATAAAQEPVPTVTWEEDLGKARALASKSGKPLFVTIRCER